MRLRPYLLLLAVALIAGCRKGDWSPPLTHMDVGGAKAVLAVWGSEFETTLLAVRADGTIEEAEMTGDALPSLIPVRWRSPLRPYVPVPKAFPTGMLRLATGNLAMSLLSAEPDLVPVDLRYNRLGAYVDVTTGDVVAVSSLYEPLTTAGRPPVVQEGPPGTLWLLRGGSYSSTWIADRHDVGYVADLSHYDPSHFRSVDLGSATGFAADRDGNLAWRDADGVLRVSALETATVTRLPAAAYGEPWPGSDGKLHVTRSEGTTTELLRIEVGEQPSAIPTATWQGTPAALEGWPAVVGGRTCFVGRTSVAVLEGLDQPPIEQPLGFQWATWAASSDAIWFEAWDADGALTRLVRWTPDGAAQDLLPAGAFELEDYSLEPYSSQGSFKFRVAPIDGESAFLLAWQVASGKRVLARVHASGALEEIELGYSPYFITGVSLP